MSKELEWEEDIAPGNEKYPALLASVKETALGNKERRHSWAKLASFTSEGTARDLASRLSKTHDEFYVIGRKVDGETEVWARLKEHVDG